MKPGIRHTLTAAAAFLLLGAGTATANPIELPFFGGEISFGGFQGSATPTGGTGLADATGIDFDNVLVTGTTLDFVGIPLGASATIFDFTFSPSTPTGPLWQVTYAGTVYEFILDTLVVTTQTSSVLALAGSGHFSATGYAETTANWVFTLNQAGPHLPSWSATTSVPEPASLALIAIGLFGIALLRRRRHSAAPHQA